MLLAKEIDVQQLENQIQQLKDQNGQLINLIHNQNGWYIAAIGTMVAIIAIIIALFGFFQWKFSDKQLNDIRKQTKQETIDELEEKYKLSDLKNNFDQIDSKINTSVVGLMNMSYDQQKHQLYNELEQCTQKLFDISKIDINTKLLNSLISTEMISVSSSFIFSELDKMEKIKILKNKVDDCQRIINSDKADKRIQDVAKSIKNDINLIIDTVNKKQKSVYEDIVNQLTQDE